MTAVPSLMRVSVRQEHAAPADRDRLLTGIVERYAPPMINLG